MKFKILLFFFCFVPVKLLAVVPVFSHYGFKQGLSPGLITSITEDHNGFLWVGTSVGVFEFNGLSFNKLDTSSISKQLIITDLLFDQYNDLWIGTRKNGLLKYSNDTLQKIGSNQFPIKSVTEIVQDKYNDIWIASDLGIYQISKEDKIFAPSLNTFKSFENMKISTLEYVEEKMIIAEGNNIHIVDLKNDQLNIINLDQELIIHDLHIDTNQNLWIGTSSKLFRYDLNNKELVSSPVLSNATRILSIKQFQNDLWVATIDGGLYQININSLKTNHFTHSKDNQYSVSEKHMTSVYISKAGHLWGGGFSTGLNFLDLELMKFGFQTNVHNSVYCANSPTFYSIIKDSKSNIWLGSDYGLIKYNADKLTCEVINLNLDSGQKNYTVYSIRFDKNIIWLASSIGLLRFNQMTLESKNLTKELKNSVIYFTYKMKNENILMGTGSGLFELNNESHIIKTFDYPNQKYSKVKYKDFVVGKDYTVYLTTPKGLLYLDENDQLKEFKIDNLEIIEEEILAVQINSKQDLFISVKDQGLIHTDSNGKVIYHYFDQESPYFTTNTTQIILDEVNQNMWLGTDIGIISVDLKSKESQVYSGTDNINYLSLKHASFRSSDEKIYFAGNSGFIEFKGEDVVSLKPDTNVIFKTLYLMNDLVTLANETPSGFVLETALDESELLEFSYKDKIIGFDFIKLNYNNPSQVNYQYKLEPVSTEWIKLLPGDRNLTFTNLKAGQYKLKLKAIENNQIGSQYTTLNFIINPPPWFTWWAFMGYAILLLFTIVFYIQRKTKAQKLINSYLNLQVKEQTKHILEQKHVVENLMARKNEIFSNVSHEFRTPITLILGPIEEMQKAEQDIAKKESFEMVKRNAKRLLSLVNQMLKLSQVSETDNQQKQMVNLAEKLNLICEPYVYLAHKNDIQLTCETFANIQLEVTDEALETIIGNFLSNAIKYTPPKGKISVGTIINEKGVEIYVNDSGAGIAIDQQKNIFKRFLRLSQHESIHGVGIGLALVKEVADLNSANLSLKSDIGSGSRFGVVFSKYQKITEHDIGHENPQVLMPKKDSNKNPSKVVLIIEDNDDMRSYIQSVVSKQFECLVASNGIEGIEMALKNIPDIIVCDVMMPEMDGFQVCRKLRSEMLTSHVPLVLLTALDEKSSRIKGWRENIDMYLNKPFDADELLLQLQNILNIRNILSHKNISDQGNDLLSNFTEVDLKFIDKLKNIVDKKYNDPLFNLEKIASLMFVSDRQLQRKTKALLNKSPMDIVRETRLEQAKNLLVKGYQISITSDKCGFSSISYFSQVFKKHCGCSPKEYQRLKTKN